MSTLAFRNDVQKLLWNEEICGQISDGHWENARPMNHWKQWCNATVVVDPSNVGRSFWAIKDSYNLLSSDLLDVVADRMLVLVRLAAVFGLFNAKRLMYCFDLTPVDGDDEPWKMVFKGMPTYEMGRDYWDGVRNNIGAVLHDCGVDLDRVRDVAANVGAFTMKDLKAELRDMKQIMKIERVVPSAVTNCQFDFDSKRV